MYYIGSKALRIPKQMPAIAILGAGYSQSVINKKNNRLDELKIGRIYSIISVISIESSDPREFFIVLL